MHFSRDSGVSSVLKSSCTRVYIAVFRAVLSGSHKKIAIFRGAFEGISVLKSRSLSITHYLGLLLISGALLMGGAARADGEIPHRILVGLNLFPNILSVTRGGQLNTPKSKHYGLWIIYQQDQKRALELAERLRHLARRINRRKVEVEVVSIRGLNLMQEGTALFIAEKLERRLLRRLVTRTRRNGELLFSPFRGDVEEGVMVGLDVRSKIRPFINLGSVEEAGLELNPTLIRMSRTRD